MQEDEVKKMCPCGNFIPKRIVLSICDCGEERPATICENCGETAQVGGHIGCGAKDDMSRLLREGESLTSVTLFSRKGCWKSPDPTFWGSMLKMAQNCGWTPAGTCCPRRVEEDALMSSEKQKWSGTYSSNDGQEVLTSDAKAFVAALELALPRLPDFDQATILAAKKVVDRAFKEQPDGFHAGAFAKGENVEGHVQQNPSGTVTGSLSPAEIREVKLEANPPVSNIDAFFKYFLGSFKRSIADLVGFVHEARHEPFDDGRAFKIS